MENSLQKKVTLTSLVRYTLPTIAMMIFFSFYTKGVLHTAGTPLIY